MFRTLLDHKLMILIIALVAAGALWWGMSQSSDPTATIVISNANGTNPITANGSTSNPLDKDTKRLIEVLLALRAVKLDDAILSNQSFMSLKDFSTQIVLEPVGRPDPFAPLGVTNAVLSGNATTTTQPIQIKNKVR